jgi:aminoglycoside phosphotransferase (APT) family kinase protein
VLGRPFVDRPVGDVDGALRLAAHVAQALALPVPELLRVGMNALFVADEVVIRVGRPSVAASLAIDLARVLSAAGIPVAQPASDEVFVDGELTATCWRRLVVHQVATDWRRVGSIVRSVHELPAHRLPAGYPIPAPTSFPWWQFDEMMADLGGDLDAGARRGLELAIERNRAWRPIDPEASVVCHGDVHPGNVVMTADGPVLLDWDLMCSAPRGWDHAMLLTLGQRWGGDPDVYAAFAEGYGESLADDAVTLRFAELRNVAATLMRVRAARADPAAAPEASVRLRYWRGEPDAPQWTAQ